MSTLGGGILGAIGGGGAVFYFAKRKIDQLEAQIRSLLQQISGLKFENQLLRNDVATQKHTIAQKDQELRQKDEQIAIRDAMINKLEQESKSLLKN